MKSCCLSKIKKQDWSIKQKGKRLNSEAEENLQSCSTHNSSTMLLIHDIPMIFIGSGKTLNSPVGHQNTVTKIINFFQYEATFQQKA